MDDAANHLPPRAAQEPLQEAPLRACPPRGALIPRAFKASAICRSDVAPLR
jgi:hypothetical protein